MTVLLRRRTLGRNSCNAIAQLTKNDITVVSNDQEWPDEDVDTVIRWGCSSVIPHWTDDTTVINNAWSIHQVNDKAGFRRLVQDQVEEVVPKTWFNEAGASEAITYPCVVRPFTHSQGKDLYLCNDLVDVITVTTRRTGPNWYASEYIPKVAEYRVCVVQGKVAWVANKIPSNPDDIAWNVAQGGRFENVRWGNWPIEAIRKSIVAFNHTDLDFGGVDVMITPDGEAYVIEINSAPSLASPYRQQCMAKCFDWIIENGKERMELNGDGRSYRKYIHPAVL